MLFLHEFVCVLSGSLGVLKLKILHKLTYIRFSQAKVRIAQRKILGCCAT